MYYKNNEPNGGWHGATDIQGFLAEKEPIILNGYFGVIVNHAGIGAIV